MRSLKISDFTKCYQDDQIQDDDVGYVACICMGQTRNPYETSVGRSVGKRLLGRPRCSERVI
jgi:hypothetical protein